jgi:hypothetical protein
MPVLPGHARPVYPPHISAVYRALFLIIIVMPLSRLASAADPHPRHRNLLLVHQYRHHHLLHNTYRRELGALCQPREFHSRVHLKRAATCGRERCVCARVRACS